MVSYAKLFLSAVAVSALVSDASAKRKLGGKRKKYPKCRSQVTPPKQDYKNVRCPEGHEIKASSVIKCSSGRDGGDHRTTDHDILIALVNHAKLGGDIDGLGPDCTCFVPTDWGIVKTAEALGCDLGGSYDEKKTITCLKDKFSVDELKDILMYHFSCEEKYTFMELQECETIKTLEGDSLLVSKEAFPTPNCKERVKLVDEYRQHKKLDWGHATIHNRFRDIKTKNCIFHAVKSLALPASVLPASTTTTAAPAADTTASAGDW